MGKTAPTKDRYARALRDIEAGRLETARQALTGLRLERPKSAEIPFQLARIAALEGRTDARAQELSRALALKPREPAILRAAAEAFAAVGESQRAEAAHDALIALDPTALKPRADKALWLQRAGRFDAAEALFRQLLRDAPQAAALYRMFFATHRVAPGEPLLKPLRALLDRAGLPPEHAAQAHYAMAKALEDQEEFGSVFPHLHAANAAQRQLAPFDPADRTREHAAYRAAQAGAALPPPTSGPTPRPVFIAGLPRSGTTLVEQIIGAHSAVSAGGEVGVALKLATALFTKETRLIPLSEAPAARLTDLGERYRTALRRAVGGDAQVGTDKSIQSALVAGYLAAALPDARFLLVERDPRDVAVSLYKMPFATGTHRYANDLADIASAIRDSRATHAALVESMPDRVTRVSYDALVRDPEGYAPRLLAAAGLDWELACLDFHRGTREVRTLSLAQVRQPIHAGASGGWRRYETDLKPFLDAWGDAPWD